MPYVFIEELEDGMEEADVVERSLYDAVITERDSVTSQRDDAISKVEVLETDLRDAKSKFADAFLSSPDRAKMVQRDDVSKDGNMQTFSELFAERNDYNAN